MRNIKLTTNCYDFIESLDEDSSTKVYKLLEMMRSTQIIHSKFIKKLSNTIFFYEMRLKRKHEIRILLFTLDHSNFMESKEVLLLNGFIKKSPKDYKKAIKKAELLLNQFLNL